MAMTKKRKKILLALGWYSYKIHRGVARYADHARWILNVELERTKLPPLRWRGDGIVCLLGSDTALDRKVLSYKVPIVNIGPVIKNRIPRVLPDNEKIGQLIAEHFLTRGFKHFAFYACLGGPSEEMRSAELARALRGKGATLHSLNWSATQHTSDMSSDDRLDWLAEQLKRLPKPLAIATDYDDRAVEVLQACENAGLHVPEEVAVLGAGNENLICDFAPVPLSSVDTAEERQGYEAAALLDRIINGARPPVRALVIPPAGIVIRKSSDMMGIGHPHVATAVRRIWQHYQEPVTAEKICQGIPISHRRLHDAFVKHVGHTMAEEIRRCRIEHAKRLLGEPERLTMEDIAERAGFSSAGQMARVFSHFLNTSPSQYRKEHIFD